MQARKFDQRFEEDISIVVSLDLSKFKRVLQDQKRVGVDFPTWMIKSLDREASKLGVTRQSVIKIWLAERLEATTSNMAPQRPRVNAALREYWHQPSFRARAHPMPVRPNQGCGLEERRNLDQKMCCLSA
jgi:hypothetical protein